MYFPIHQKGREKRKKNQSATVGAKLNAISKPLKHGLTLKQLLISGLLSND
jgi:hypothetical protein